MLEAVHAYASRFYATLNRRLEADWLARRGTYPYALPQTGATEHVDERSMDETALLAFGVLLEEAGVEALGSKGHLVFTEWATDEDERDGWREEEEEDDDAESGPDPFDEWETASTRPRKRRRADDDW